MCDYSDAYILLKGTITAAAAANNVDKKVIFKISSPFTNCISRINNKQVDDAHKTDVAMSMYTFIEYSDNYSKTSGKYCRDEPALGITDFSEGNVNTISFKIREKMAQWHKTCWNNGTILSSFWKTLEMSSINWETKLDLD